MRIRLKAPSMKNWKLALLTVVLCLIAIEAALWFISPPPKPYPMAPGLLVLDKRGAWILRPNQSGTMNNRVDFLNKKFSIDERGMRGVPAAGSVRNPESRVFVIGDSQTFGFGLSDGETWPARLQVLLNEQYPGSFLVENLGVPGVNISQYFARIDGIVKHALRPGDRVLIGVTWNDFHTAYTERGVKSILSKAGVDVPGEVAGDEAAVSMIETPVAPLRVAEGGKPITAQLVEPLRVYQPPTWRYRLYLKTGIFVPVFASVHDFAISAAYSSAIMGILIPQVRNLYYLLRPSDTFFRKVGETTFRKNAMMLKAAERVIKAQGADVYVVALPNRIFFDKSYYNYYSKNGQVFPAQDFLWHELGPLCDRLELKCLNTFDDLKTDRPDWNNFRADGHYNERGADAISRSILRQAF